jgi:hypothetical protein
MVYTPTARRRACHRIAQAYPEFLEQYAREGDQADALAEEMLDVARSALRAKSSEEAQGYRLLVDTLKWHASKMKPKSYGGQTHPRRGRVRSGDDRRGTEQAARVSLTSRSRPVG